MDKKKILITLVAILIIVLSYFIGYNIGVSMKYREQCFEAPKTTSADVIKYATDEMMSLMPNASWETQNHTTETADQYYTNTQVFATANTGTESIQYVAHIQCKQGDITIKKNMFKTVNEKAFYYEVNIYQADWYVEHNAEDTSVIDRYEFAKTSPLKSYSITIKGDNEIGKITNLSK